MQTNRNLQSVQPRPATIESCKNGFLNPPDTARPGVYWYFMDGSIHEVSNATRRNGLTQVPIRFAAYQSYFVVFKNGGVASSEPSDDTAFPLCTPEQELSGPWQVEFDPARGGPANIEFERLQDWTARIKPTPRCCPAASSARCGL